MNSLNLFFIFLLSLLIIFIIYVVLLIKCENKQLIEKVFKWIFAIMPIIMLVICIVFLLVMKDNSTDYFALFVLLFIIFVFINTLNKKNISYEKFINIIPCRLVLYFVVQTLLYKITIVLEKELPMLGLVFNRFSIVVIISFLMYFIYQILILLNERKTKIFRLAFEINNFSYITIYILFYLIQDNDSSDISKIIVLCSLLFVFFDKIDDLIEYFICDSYDDKREIEK